MKKFFLCVLVLLSAFNSQAQFSDNFNDGNFTANPTWTGNTADWTVNTSFQLQSNNTVANSTYYLSTASTLAISAQWEFYVNIDFNPSSANYIDVFVTASAGDLTLNTTSGYFIRIGNTDDEISLYRKDASGTVAKIIDGVNSILNTSSNVMKIKLIRNAANQWTLFRDLTGTGSTYTSEGSVTDATFNTSAFFGIFVKQSTASFFQKHFFDDITASVFVPDVTPPQIVSATALAANTVDVLFNEPVDLTTGQAAANYSANNGIGIPATVVRDASNTSLVHLTFSGNFPNGSSNTLTVNGVKDLSGNTLVNGTATFSFYIPQQYDIVIDEIMADPSPQVGLPNLEWIELRNTSANTINLAGWKIGQPTSQSGAMPSFVLKPDSFVIVCTGSAVAAMSVFGPTISVTSFPALSNTGDLLSLISKENKIIHAVNYSDTWYQNQLKRDGGWTLEMIDTKNPCAGAANWRASVYPSGGTPAKKNSIDAVNRDQSAPRLLRAFAVDNLNITLVLDGPLDSAKAATASNYTVSDGIGTPQFAVALSPLFDRVALRLVNPLQVNKVYSVTASNVVDCANNVIGANKTARVGLSSVADSLDVVINEILFNPRPDGVDYVEIYNRSQKIVDLKQLSIANRSSTGVISSIKQLSLESIQLFPGDFMVITEDELIVKQQYITPNPDAFDQVTSMPSFSDDKGNVIILNSQGRIVDEVKYDDKWHFALVTNTEGVSLERIDYSGPSTQINFHSAANSVGYGTPGYKNSQYMVTTQVQGEIVVTPEIFSPDNDGIDDIATITYNFLSPGYVANITIFDASGRPVRYLQRNALSGITGFYRWDGLGEKQQKLPVGIYIVLSEIFNLDGKKKVFKNTIVLARRFN